MAYRQIDWGNIKKYIGESTDTKPTHATAPYGSEFYEKDTKSTKILDATGAWVEKAVEGEI